VKREALLDLAIVIVGFMLILVGGDLIGLPVPGVLAIIGGLLLAWWRLRARSESWSSIGLRRPASFPRLILAVVVLYAISVAGVVGIVYPVSDAMGWQSLELLRFDDVRGNPLALARILLIAWTTAAFGEEMLFRGFVLTRLEKALGRGTVLLTLAIVIQAVLFGLGHAYLGARGVLTAVWIGLVYGTWYVLRDRNLWPLILTHGLTDTISMLAIYSGAVPE